MQRNPKYCLDTPGSTGDDISKGEVNWEYFGHDLQGPEYPSPQQGQSDWERAMKEVPPQAGLEGSPWWRSDA